MRRIRGGLGLSGLGVYALLSAAPACAQSDCEANCEAAKECPNVPASFANVSCGDACDFQRQSSEDAGCLAEWEAFNACGAAHLDQACESGTCGEEATAWGDCLDGS